MTDDDYLPPRLKKNSKKDRVFKSSLPADLFLQLQVESTERGTTPFKLTGLVMTAYLSGNLSKI